MRQIDPKIIEERKKKILQAIIHHYVKTARPVGSNVLNEDYNFDLSPATIRGIMSELEEEGFLSHPHTSAGRVPTDKGYRYYVDSLIELQRLALDEEDRIKKEYLGKIREIESLLSHTSKVLSVLSQYSGFVLTPKLERNYLRHLQLIPLENKKVLVVLITHTGMVKHHIIEADISNIQLNRLSSLLNDNLKGLTLLEAKKRILEKLEEAEREERELFNFAKHLGKHIFEIEEEEIFINGTSNVSILPEFHEYEPMYCLLRLTEQRNLLSKVFDEDFDFDKVKVLIGSESDCQELQNLSVVSSVYKDGKIPIGVLGIIGPKRMEYPKMISIVDNVSKIVNKILAKLGG